MSSLDAFTLHPELEELLDTLFPRDWEPPGPALQPLVEEQTQKHTTSGKPPSPKLCCASFDERYFPGPRPRRFKKTQWTRAPLLDSDQEWNLEELLPPPPVPSPPVPPRPANKMSISFILNAEASPTGFGEKEEPSPPILCDPEPPRGEKRTRAWRERFARDLVESVSERLERQKEEREDEGRRGEGNKRRGSSQGFPKTMGMS